MHYCSHSSYIINCLRLMENVFKDFLFVCLFVFGLLASFFRISFFVCFLTSLKKMFSSFLKNKLDEMNLGFSHSI